MNDRSTCHGLKSLHPNYYGGQKGFKDRMRIECFLKAVMIEMSLKGDIGVRQVRIQSRGKA